MMSSISQDIIDAVKKISAETLCSRGALQLVPNKHDEYICPAPDCDNGTGRDATGIKPHDTGSHVGYKCHKCGAKFDNVQILAWHYGLNAQRDFREVIEKACAEFGIHGTEENIQPAAQISDAQRAALAAAEKNIIKADLSSDATPLINLLKSLDGKWRGLTVETLLHFGCRYIPEWTSPKSRTANKFSTPTPRMLIPNVPNGSCYLARLTCSITAFNEDNRKWIHAKEHAGKKLLFNPAALMERVVFAVEGAIDAASIVQCGFPAVALGGADSFRLLVDALKKQPVMPKIISLLDSDSTGRTFAPRLRDALAKIGCQCAIRFLFDEDSKIDCNQILIDDGEDNLRGRLKEIYDSALAEFATTSTPKTDDSSTAAVNNALKLSPELIEKLKRANSTTDAANAERLIDLFPNSFRFLAPPINEWLIWHETYEGEGKGGAWKNAGSKKAAVGGFVYQLSQALTANLPNKTLGARLEKSRYADSTISFLTNNITSIRITDADLNSNPYLINVLNGVVDLTTGKRYDADPLQYHYRQAPVVYNPRANERDVFNFLRSIMVKKDSPEETDEELLRGLLRFLGSSLTGDVCNHKAAILTGSGRNGKGTLTRFLQRIYGADYSCSVDIEPFLIGTPRGAGSPNADFYNLRGRRLAIVDEIKDGTRSFDMSTIKKLTGGDRITARALFSNYIDGGGFDPEHTLILVANKWPSLTDSDDKAFRARILNWPFYAVFLGSEDYSLDAKLSTPAALSTGFNLLLRGCRDWLDNGRRLILPDAVAQETEKFFAESDWFKSFVEEHCIIGDEYHCKRKNFVDKLRAEYPRACRQFKTQTALHDYIQQRLDNWSGAKIYAAQDNRDRTVFLYGIGLAEE